MSISLVDLGLDIPIEIIETIGRFISNNIIQTTALLILLYLVVYFLYQKKRAITIRSIVGGMPRGLGTEKWNIDYYNVKWEGVIKRPDPIIGGNVQVWISGPYCPKDMRSLESENIKIGLIYLKSIWKCPSCETEYNKPKKSDKHIKDDVSDWLEAEEFRKK